MVAIFGFLLTGISIYNIGFNLGKVGDKEKLKQLMIIIGVPIFLIILIYTFLFG